MDIQFEKYRVLLSGFIDGELSPEEAMEVQEQLNRNEALREEYEALIKVSDSLEGVSFVEPQEEDLENLWRTPFSHGVKVTAMTLIIGGYAFFILVGTALFFSSENDMPFIFKLCFGAMALGGVILAYQVLRDRFISYSKDPYKEIKR